jgi:hypothetical protein
VYVSSSNAVVYALDATTGQQFWSTNTGDQLSLSSPTVANGVVYYGTFNDNVWAFDASTGEKLWSYKTGRAVNAKPTVVNGKVYVGSDNMYAFGLPGGGQQVRLQAEVGRFSDRRHVRGRHLGVHRSVSDELALSGEGDTKPRPNSRGFSFDPRLGARDPEEVSTAGRVGAGARASLPCLTGVGSAAWPTPGPRLAKIIGDG